MTLHEKETRVKRVKRAKRGKLIRRPILYDWIIKRSLAFSMFYNERFKTGNNIDSQAMI